MNRIILHHAPWIASIAQPVSKDGAVAVKKGRIIDVGSFSNLQDKYPQAQTIFHPRCVLLPPLVNAHIHLELSHIRLAEKYKPIDGFTGWIENLLAAREEVGAIGELAEAAAQETLRQQTEQGVIAIGDIGNTDIGEKVSDMFAGILMHFHEVLGRSQKSRKSILAKISAADNAKRFTAHAPYSTHPELIQALKKRACTLGHPFPIHTAEPPSENELLTSGSGELYKFLKQRGFIDDSYDPPSGIDNLGSVQYLHSLGVLDKNTICVHSIHVHDEEVRLLAHTGSRVCLCPGSNRYLGVGTAPVKKYLDHDILPALGTDSRASNPELSIWREMRILSREQQNILPDDILAMATLGGAQALGIDKDFGTLSAGKKGRFLAVKVPEHIRSADDILTFLVSDNFLVQPEWINEQ